MISFYPVVYVELKVFSFVMHPSIICLPKLAEFPVDSSFG